ncbi:MAG: GtrA family protein [Firmicutes bacterium]|nr:GtrA family protein [Bacillota bacterium]
MNKLKEKIFNKETISYLIFGVLTTIVSYVSYFLAQRLLMGVMGRDASIMVANVISWVLAVSFAYVTNKLYVFESKSWKREVIIKEIASFVGARLFSFGFETAWMWITAIVLGFNDAICKLLAQVAITLMNYFFSKLFIFKKKKETENV